MTWVGNFVDTEIESRKTKIHGNRASHQEKKKEERKNMFIYWKKKYDKLIVLVSIFFFFFFILFYLFIYFFFFFEKLYYQQNSSLVAQPLFLFFFSCTTKGRCVIKRCQVHGLCLSMMMRMSSDLTTRQPMRVIASKRYTNFVLQWNGYNDESLCLSNN